MRLPVASSFLSLLLLAGCPTTDKPADDTSAETGTETETETETETDYHWPEPGTYADPGIPGWMGRTRISTDPGCWLDTDGVDPGVAGCHTLHGDGEECDSCDAEVGGQLGELCYTFTRTVDGETQQASLLIETNPAAGECHPHKDGVGHPDVFDCDVYCKGTTDPELGTPYSGGSCEAVEYDACPGGAVTSAWCACTP